MRFIDLHTHSLFSSGVDSPLRLLHHAGELGVEIGICDGQRHGQCPSGVEIHAKNKKDLYRGLKKFEDLDYFLVHGGDEKINRLAVGDSRVDILAHPDLGRKDSGIDSFIARKASENGVAIEVNLGGIIFCRGAYRMYAIKNIKRNLMLSRKYGFDMVATTGAKSRFDLRDATTVYEILKLLGFNEEEAFTAMEKSPRRALE